MIPFFDRSNVWISHKVENSLLLCRIEISTHPDWHRELHGVDAAFIDRAKHPNRVVRFTSTAPGTLIGNSPLARIVSR
jgi:hypothetical protein